MSRLLDRWSRLPRAARWGAAFVAFVATYFVVVEPALDFSAELGAKADRAAVALQRYSDQATARTEADRDIALGVSSYGDVALPGDSRARQNELFSRISAILQKHGIDRPNITAGRPIPLGREVLVDIVGPNQEVQKLVFDLKIEGTPESIAAVISDLERTPQVTAVGQVTLRRTGKEADRKLQATILPEAWVIGERGGGRR